MDRWGACGWVLIATLSACGGETTAAPPPDEPVTTVESYPPFDEAIAMTSRCASPDVVAIEVRSIEIAERGTRSQTMTLSAVVLASKNDLITITLDVSHYVGGDVFMEEGGRYVAVLCSATQVLGWRPLSGDPEAAVNAVELPASTAVAE